MLIANDVLVKNDQSESMPIHKKERILTHCDFVYIELSMILIKPLLYLNLFLLI